jgi:aspartokinase
MNNLLVMKFGGTSMGSAERIQVAAKICQEQKQKRAVLAVVSAMSGVTDLLLGTLKPTTKLALNPASEAFRIGTRRLAANCFVSPHVAIERWLALANSSRTFGASRTAC